MSRTKVVLMSAMTLAFTVAMAGQAFSQPGQGPGVIGSGPMTPEQKKQMYTTMAQQLKEPLGANEEEWKALEPKVVDFITQRSEYASSVVFSVWLLNPNFKLPSESLADDKKTDLQKKTEALWKLLLDKDSKAEDIKAALTDYRDARDKAKKDLDTAKKNLRDLLTVRQEAILVMSGQLD